MFVTVQALQVLDMLFLLEFSDFVLCKCLFDLSRLFSIFAAGISFGIK